MSIRSQDSAVVITTSYGLEDRRVGVPVPVGPRIVSFPRLPDRLLGAPNLQYYGYRGAISQGLQRSGREADHSPPASAEVKNMWIYTATPPYASMA
jgi:hypothetical protein